MASRIIRLLEDLRGWTSIASMFKPVRQRTTGRNRFHLDLVLNQPLQARREVSVNKLHKLFPAALVELADDSDIPDLLVGEFAVRAVNLGEDVASINEQDAVIFLGLVKEPQRLGARASERHHDARAQLAAP